jgi:hypothetical protein
MDEGLGTESGAREMTGLYILEIVGIAKKGKKIAFTRNRGRLPASDFTGVFFTGSTCFYRRVERTSVQFLYLFTVSAPIAAGVHVSILWGR